MRKTKRAARSLKQDFNRRYADNRPVNFSQAGFLCRFSFLRKAVKKHAERAVPAGTKFPIGKFQSFLPYFLYLTKSRKKLLLGRAKSCRWQVFVRRRPPKQGELRTDVSKATMFQGDRAAKDLILLVRFCSLSVLIRGLQNLESLFGKVLILFVRSRHCGELNRGLQNLDSPFGKVLILLVRSRHCGELNRGLQNLEAPCKGTDWYFLRRAKSTAKTRRGLRPSGLPGTIQSSIEEDFSKVFQWHETKPVFRTKRQRKGFESVRCSGVTA